MRWDFRVWGVVVCALAACGGGSADDSSASGSNESGIGLDDGDSGADSTADSAGTAGSAESGGSVSQSGTSNGDDSGEGSASAEDGSSAGDESESDSGNDDDTGNNCNGTGGGNQDYDFSIIWIANTGEGTMSKIDTVTGVELARYRTGPGNMSPSRTSVNLEGDVVVGNRNGSVSKFATREEDCIDRNSNGTIDTSTGPGDVYDWQEDECWIWYHDVEFQGGSGGPRAIAWDSGENYVEDPCNPGEARVWVGWRNQPDNDVIIRRLRGNDGAIDNEVLVEDWNCNWDHGTYGGATDAVGNFWALGTRGTLVRVDAVTFEATRYDNPDDNVVYGITLDQDGNPWIAGWDGLLWKFDVATETFTNMGASGGDRLRGIAVDSNGMAWAAANDPCGLTQYDTINESVVDFIDLEDCSEPVGVSIDADGFVWVVDRGADRAYKVHPTTYATTEVTGLVDPYTYSDMTGSGLSLVVVPQ